MGRALRVLGEGLTYHVMARGNNRREIFAGEGDHEIFIDRLGVVCARHSWTCHAYCLMPNHVHLAVTTPAPTLASGMRDLLGGYARGFNRRHRRTGHLFSARYRDVVVRDTRQLIAVVAYVNRNPVRAGIVERASEWPWSGYAATMDLSPGPPYLDPRQVLAALGADVSDARSALEELVEGDSAEFDALPDVVAAAVPSARSLSAGEILSTLGAAEGTRVCLRLGFRQREIARELGITPSALSHRLASGDLRAA